MTIQGFLIQAWMHGQDLRLCGRTRDGRSFATSLTPPERLRHLADHGMTPDQSMTPFPGTSGPEKAAFREEEEFLLRLGIRGALSITGRAKQGTRVDLALSEATIQALECKPCAHWLAIDIETNREAHITAVSLVPQDADGEVHLLQPDSPDPGAKLPDWILCHGSEKELLVAVTSRIVQLDPDVITGWNVADFDFTVLAERCKAHRVRFDAGRTRDEEAWVRKAASGLTRVVIPGRQVVDAMRIVRASGERYADLKLQTVAQAILGTGKTVSSSGEDKLAELDRLYHNDPLAFCGYCREDSRLVLQILEKTGLDRLSLERAALTGTNLELAWTSIPAFERIYALELWQRGIDPPPRQDGRLVSGAAGGTVLDPDSGLFHKVWVFDFKSLYPTIMRTFNIDPLSHARALLRPALPQDILAPNGARFDRQPGILGGLVGAYFDKRMIAQAAGDEVGAYVYKILMNSFYGVLGSGGCRYGRTELAGAITGFGRFFLHMSRDFFQEKGYRVLYGDTDSVFVHAGGTKQQGQTRTGLNPRDLAQELNSRIATLVKERWDCTSFLQIRFEKEYEAFMIPRLRSGTSAVAESGSEDEPVRGRAKGYAGLLLAAPGAMDDQIEVKGMEAARSDYTALAVRFQRELLSRIFHNEAQAAVASWVRGFMTDLFAGKLDEELVYRKILRRAARDYTANEPPQVKVARELGWTDRRGRVEYILTTDGPHALELYLKNKEGMHPDYKHYVEHQLQPIWESLADAADRSDRPADPEQGTYMATRPLDLSAGRGQLELGW